MNKQKRYGIIALAFTMLCLLALTFALGACNTNGGAWFYGEESPSSSLGNNGDFYLNTSNNFIYEKADDEWQIIYQPKEYKNTSVLLPNVMYAAVGQTIEIYFRNIIAYSLDDVLISTGTNLPNSKQLADKWTSTPTAAGLYVLRISIYSKDWELIASKRVDIVVKETTSTTSLKALVVGDSTLCTGEETAKMLELARIDDKVDLSLLGTINDLGDGNVAEGRVGWQASTYTSQEIVDNVINPFYNTSTHAFDFRYYMQQQNYDKVDVVFIQLGINDIFNALEDTIDQAVKTYISAMDEMITSIHSYDPNVKVVINMIIPCCQDQSRFGNVYGVRTVWDYMRKMYRANLALLDAFSERSNVYLSYYNASLDVANNQPNDVHPTTEGYYQLGYQMYYYMKAIES